jgi:hypothetical protein
MGQQGCCLLGPLGDARGLGHSVYILWLVNFLCFYFFHCCCSQDHGAGEFVGVNYHQADLCYSHESHLWTKMSRERG